MIRIAFIIISIGVIFGSCDNSMKVDGKKVIADLAFHKASTEKEYADLILHAIKTNRDKVLIAEFDDTDINSAEFNRIISGYSQSIGSRDWDFVDVDSYDGIKNLVDGIDYNWHDKRGRIAIQVNIQPNKNENNRFSLNKIEFRSRLEILPSFSFPGGEITDYKKIAEKK